MINRDVIMQDAVGETANGNAIDVKGLSQLAIQITGTFVATITFECTVDSTNWVSLQMINVSTGKLSTAATATGVYTCPVAGLYQARARVSSWTSGSVTAIGYAVNVSKGNPQFATVDASTWARNVISYAHHEIHAGSHFYAEGTQDIANGASLDFLWVCPGSTKWPHALWELDAEVEMTMSMYEDVSTSNNGTPITIFNNNRNSDTAATVTGFVSPTLTSGTLGDAGNGGTLVWKKTIGSGKKIGGEGGRNHEFIGKSGSKYWFKISNASGGAGWLNYDFNWYEHTDKS